MFSRRSRREDGISGGIGSMKLFFRGGLAFGIFSEGGGRRIDERLILRKDSLD